jgi:hypothetical protein
MLGPEAGFVKPGPGARHQASRPAPVDNLARMNAINLII